MHQEIILNKLFKQYTHRDSDGGVVHMPEFWHASTACWCPNSCSIRIQPSYLTFVFRKKGKAKVACEILQRTQPEFGHCSCLYISYARQLLFFFFSWCILKQSNKTRCILWAVPPLRPTFNVPHRWARKDWNIPQHFVTSKPCLVETSQPWSTLKGKLFKLYFLFSLLCWCGFWPTWAPSSTAWHCSS